LQFHPLNLISSLFDHRPLR